jgi:hypothetical protein
MAITLQDLYTRRNVLLNAIDSKQKEIREIENALLTSRQTLIAQEGALRQVELFIQQIESQKEAEAEQPEKKE